jgi:hypothetical protein
MQLTAEPLPAQLVTYLDDVITGSCCDIASVLLPHDKHEYKELTRVFGYDFGDFSQVTDNENLIQNCGQND